MNVISYASTLAHQVNSLQLDDSSISLIALLVGMIGGWRVTGWHAQLKAKRARIDDKPRNPPRKPR